MPRRAPRAAIGWAMSAVLTCWLVLPRAASAHHGIANFDMEREIAITGTVAELAFVNPHSWLYLSVAEEDGRLTSWRCELRGAAVLRRSGWSPELFAPGTEVTITGAPDRFQPHTCYLGTVVFADGTRIDRYGQIQRPEPAPPAERPARLASGRPNLSGDWAAEQRMLTDPRGMSGAFLPMSVARQLEPGAVPEGMQPFPGARGSDVARAEDPIAAYWNRPSAMPLTEAGARAIADFDGASTDNPRLRCEPTNILFDWGFEADVNRIVQRDDTITLLYGSMGLERTIRLDLAAHPAEIEPSRAGHSIGWWEGDVLVVDTIGFAPGILSADGRVPHSDQLHVVERFSLDPERHVLRRTYVAEDPLYFEGAYKGADVVHVADVPYQVTPCDDRSFKTDTDAALEARWPIWAVSIAGGLLVIGSAGLWRRLARSRRGSRQG